MCLGATVFPVFGATTPQIAMLPLVAILAITAFKDGIEDYRRADIGSPGPPFSTLRVGAPDYKHHASG